MKYSIHNRGLSLLLCLLMAVGLFTVCGFGVAAQGTKELEFQTWNAGALADAAAAVGTKNSHDYPIFTSYTQCIGRRSLGTTGPFIHNARVEHQKNGELQYYDGLSVSMIVRLIADDGYDAGNLCTFDLAYKLNDYPDQYLYAYPVTIDEYDAAVTQTDPVYGYEYKEFIMSATLEGEVFDDAADNTMEMRVISNNTDYSVTIFSLELIDMDDNVLAKFEGEGMSSLPGIEGTYEPISNDPDHPAGIVSYSGSDAPALSWRGEPYTIYNADGQKAAGSPGALLVDGLGDTLDEGDYSFRFNMSTMYSLGTKKVLFTVVDQTAGGEEIARLFVDKDMVDATVGSDSGIFEDRSVPFTIDAARAGHRIQFQVFVYNETDFKLRSASLNLVVDADAAAPDDAQAVIDVITGMDIADAQAIAGARTAYDALNTLGKAWVGADLAAKLAQYEQAQIDATAVKDAIADLGSKDDLNDGNYAEKTQALETAEGLYSGLARTYGKENADKLAPNASAISEYRAAYEDAKRLAEIKRDWNRIVEMVDAIGPVESITPDNVVAKEEALKTVARAVKEFCDIYSNDPNFALISNFDKIENRLTELQNKIDEIKASRYELGKVNDDDSIDAADALLALQHSVHLTTLEGDAFLAADVSGDGHVDAADALLILQCSVNLIQPEDFPAAQKDGNKPQ